MAGSLESNLHLIAGVFDLVHLCRERLHRVSGHEPGRLDVVLIEELEYAIGADSGAKGTTEDIRGPSWGPQAIVNSASQSMPCQLSHLSPTTYQPLTAWTSKP